MALVSGENKSQGVRKIAVIEMLINFLLILFKMNIGIIGGSQLGAADAFHLLSESTVEIYPKNRSIQANLFFFLLKRR